MPIIYKITNTINNKLYIGCTIKSIEERFLEHVSRSKNSKYTYKLHNAINKYGSDNFIIEELIQCTIDEMYFLEVEYIEKYNSFNNGYNSTLGGEGCLGYTHSEETRKKMSEIQKEKMKELRADKNYEDIYGDNALIERFKRSESVKKYWENCTQDEKEKRANSTLDTLLKKSGYTREMILEIRQLKKSGMKPKEINKKFPELTSKQITNILDKRR